MHVANNASSPILVALDYPDMAQAMAMAERLDPSICRVKVGKELFTRCGPAIIEALQKKDFQVFLDLKFHDIPNTTANAVAVAAELGVWMVNVHASGGRRMLEACVDRLSTYSQRPLLIGVTVLTSMQREDLQGIGLDASPIAHVERLAALSKQAGLDGVVCSSHEVSQLKLALGEQFKLVTPGIRPLDAALGDQKRVMTPAQALAAGSDYLVIGRPITQANDPDKALRNILAELS
jgi:orotidine-5'-phosphate decarboxylase